MLIYILCVFVFRQSNRREAAKRKAREELSRKANELGGQNEWVQIVNLEQDEMNMEADF